MIQKKNSCLCVCVCLCVTVIIIIINQLCIKEIYFFFFTLGYSKLPITTTTTTTITTAATTVFSLFLKPVFFFLIVSIPYIHVPHTVKHPKKNFFMYSKKMLQNQVIFLPMCHIYDNDLCFLKFFSSLSLFSLHCYYTGGGGDGLVYSIKV